MSYSVREKGWIFETVFVSDSNTEVLKEESSEYRYSIYLPRIFNLAGISEDGSMPYQDTIYASIFHQQEVEGTYFAMDKNRNQDFLDDEIIPIVENIPVRYELPVSGVSNGNEESEYKIPLKIEYRSGRNELLITSLLKYDVEYSIADTALRVVLNVGT